MAKGTTSVRPEDLDPPRYVIVCERASAMAELARWLFERQGIAYEEQGHAPLMSETLGRTHQGIVVSAAQTWKGAHETLHALDRRLRAGDRLFGEDPEERRRNITFAEQLIDRLLLPVRRVVFFHLLPHRRLVIPLVSDAIPMWERAVIAIAFPIWRKRLQRLIEATSHVVSDDVRRIEEAFALVASELEARGSRFLNGASPGNLDIIFAALAAPVTLPQEYRSPMPAFDALPAAFRTVVDNLRARNAARVVADTYAIARPHPQPALQRPRKDQTVAQRLLGPAVLRAGARAAAAWGSPIVVKRFALASRWGDVQQVLEDDLTYRIEPINGPNFATISGTFVLGLDRGAQFARERQQMYEAVSRIDLADLRARIRADADALIADALAIGDRIDVAHGYAHPVAARTAVRLFGIRGPTEAELMRVCRALFHFSFLANPNETQVTERARRAAEELRSWIVEEIERRRRDGVQIDDVLGRLIALRDGRGTPLDDDAVRRILSGLLVGAIDTTAPAVPRIVSVIASDPELLARVRSDVDHPRRMLGWCWEALRMWAPAPVLFRRTFAPASLAGRTIPGDCKVAAFTQAAMFDRGAFPVPAQFNPERPMDSYMNFGGGLHPCAGRGINSIQLPELVARLLRFDIADVGRPRFVGPFLDELTLTIRRPQR